MNSLLIKYKQGTIVEKLIYINIAAFVLLHLVNTLFFLFGNSTSFIFDWFALSSNPEILISRPWSIITYGFLHGGFIHILSNLIVLYYIGNLFIDYFTQKQLLNFYVLGTFVGGVLYLLSYNFFPVFKNSETSLVGASAAVMAIFVGLATYIPYYEVNLRFIGYVKLWILAAIFLGIDLIQLSSNNSGGHLAHLGGALFGYLYVTYYNPEKLKIFKKKSPLKTVYRSTTKKQTTTATKTNQEQVDKILDKISKSGYDSLNQQEKDLLFKQGKN